MILDLIAFSVFLAGFIGMSAIALRKAPALAELPETASSFTWRGFLINTGKGTFSLVRAVIVRIGEIPLVKGLINMLRTSAKAKNLLDKVKESALVKKLTPPKNFSPELLLQKILSKVRVLVLKMDHKTSTWLQALRERAKRRSTIEKDNYWKKLKKFTRK